jgi:hypothetical protein
MLVGASEACPQHRLLVVEENLLATFDFVRKRWHRYPLPALLTTLAAWADRAEVVVSSLQQVFLADFEGFRATPTLLLTAEGIVDVAARADGAVEVLLASQRVLVFA